MERGGDQFIPRPDVHALGDPAPWHDLPHAARRFTAEEVRAAVAGFGPAADPNPAHADLRVAAVLLALFERDGEAHVVFIKRPATMSMHQGQIAFPGGTRDSADVDLVATALRETAEEVGLAAELVEVVGQLDAIATIATPFVVSPFIGLLAEEPVFVPEPAEVDALLVVPLSQLFDEAAFREERWELPADLELYGPPERNVYFYELPGETIWGATARILTDFLARLAATRR